MAITTAVCNSFKQELFVEGHDFTNSTGDTFKLALYLDASATLGAATTAYTDTGEVSDSGTGYTAGGYDLTSATPTLSGATVICDFTNTITIGSASFSSEGSLIYNSSNSNKAVCVNAFGETKTASGGDFVINFPTPDASNAILRLA